MIAAHPYEEVAYDVYPLDNPGRELGCLKAGDLEPPMLGDQFLQHVLQSLASDTARTIGEMPGVVTHVAVCPGSGASFLDAVAHSGAEVYVTGDLKHHDALRAKELGLAVVDVGHAVSEEVAVELLERKLRTLTADLAESGETATLHRVRQSCQSYPWHDVKVEVFGTWDTRSRRPER
jgi:putative NIF3 family GTP cyclohydrolase 1 type 2